MHTEAIHWPPRWAMHPLARAFALSLLLHALLFTTLEVGNRYDLWRFSPWVMLAKALNLNLDASRTATELKARANALEAAPVEEEQVIPIQFVDVDPTQATAEAPAKTPYYSAVSSVAANRDTQRDTDTPELDGTQDKVLKTMNTARAETPQPLQPAPVAPQQPQDGLSVEAVKPQPVTPTPVKPAPAPPPAEPPTPAERPGETLIAKANPVVSPAITVQVPAPEPAAATRARPRTVAAAMAQRQMNPNSALVGEKLKQEGGVKRFSIASSLNVQASPLGSYDAKFIAAVQQCWFGLLEEQRYSLDRVGKVVVDFRLTSDGRITDVKVAQSDVGEIYTTLCELAIRRPAPYEKWPADVRRMVGGNHRDVRFTFYY